MDVSVRRMAGVLPSEKNVYKYIILASIAKTSSIWYNSDPMGITRETKYSESAVRLNKY